MEIRILADADAVAREAARVIAAEARAAVAARGRFIVAVSGGRTPWQMLRALAGEEVPWGGVHVVWTSASPPPEIPTVVSRTCARVCSGTRRHGWGDPRHVGASGSRLQHAALPYAEARHRTAVRKGLDRAVGCG